MFAVGSDKFAKCRVKCVLCSVLFSVQCVVWNRYIGAGACAGVGGVCSVHSAVLGFSVLPTTSEDI